MVADDTSYGNRGTTPEERARTSSTSGGLALATMSSRPRVRHAGCSIFRHRDATPHGEHDYAIDDSPDDTHRSLVI